MTTSTQGTYDVDAVRRAYLDAPDEAVFLERAHIIREAAAKYRDLPPGTRQGRIIAELCSRITPLVNECDVFLGRLLEEVPREADEAFIREHPELFIEQGVPGVLDSTGIYCPDWGRLLQLGIGGLVDEVSRHEKAARGAGDDERTDWLEGVRTSLDAISNLAKRYAENAKLLAAGMIDEATRARLLAAAEAAERVSWEAPGSFREALQLYLFFLFVLAAIVGGRNVTPGRVDRWLMPFYERDVSGATISRREAVELLAVAMTMLSQLSGKVSTDFQSTKRTPNRYSHYYVTLGGSAPDGRYEVNDLSFAMLDAVKLAGLREPTIQVRYAPNIECRFWREALAMMRDGRPVIAYNDEVVTAALMRCGVPRDAAFDYVHAGCMNVLLPGRGTCCLRDNHNTPAAILCVMNSGRDPATGKVVFPNAPDADTLAGFDEFFEALRAQVRFELAERFKGFSNLRRDVPLPAWPLYEGHLDAAGRYLDVVKPAWDEHLTGVATTVDSLLAVREVVYDKKMMTLSQFADALRAGFKGRDTLRLYVTRRVPSYGNDDPEVIDMIQRVARMWIDEVAEIPQKSIRVRPGFHSWLYNILMGSQTPATPDGRLAGEAFSSDFLPSPGRAIAPTATLGCMAALPHSETPSGGSTLALDLAHFRGEAGLDRLAALVEGYFAQGGLQLHFIFTDAAALLDAVEHPEKHCDLLVRVTGYSEYFVRLTPEVQRDIINRAQRR